MKVSRHKQWLMDQGAIMLNPAQESSSCRAKQVGCLQAVQKLHGLEAWMCAALQDSSPHKVPCSRELPGCWHQLCCELAWKHACAAFLT